MDGLGISLEEVKSVREIHALQTGVFLYDESVLKSTITTVNRLFKSHYQSFQLAYSIKANNHPLVLKTVLESGTYLEVSSLGELEKAINAGCDSENIVVNTPWLSKSLLQRSSEVKALVNVDSLNQLEQLSESNQPLQIGLRFTFPLQDQKSSRFGIEVTEANLGHIKNILKGSNVEVVGIHCHFWTAERHHGSYRQRLEKLLHLYDQLIAHFPVRLINIGGGFMGSLPKDLADQFDGKLSGWDDYATSIGETIAHHFRNRSDGPLLMIEPGSSLVADSFAFLTEVLDVKSIGEENYALVNASNIWLKPTGHSKKLVFEKIGDGQGSSFTNCKMVGITCMEKDVIGNFHGELKIGDKLLFQNMGAYTMSYSPNFIIGPPEVKSFQFKDVK